MLHGLQCILFKGLPGCFFTRTSLLKSSNNLEPMCKKVNVKSSWLVIFRIISVTSSFTVWGTHTTNGNLKNLNVIIFPIPLYLTIYSTRFSLSRNCLDGLVVIVFDSYFGGRGFDPQPYRLLCWFYFIFYWWIVFIELLRFILKLIFNYYFKFERNLF